ncbi:MAG: LacI family DNA-binding transcriptional regulator [Terrimicrobiaceae bacterium]
MKKNTKDYQVSKRVTLRDLALELGLSDRAVSQALNPRASNVKLNSKTVERIKELAAKRNYRRDSRARSMRYGRFFNIGYFEAKAKTTAWSLLGAESGVCDAAIDHDYHVVLIRLPSDLSSEPASIPSIFRESNLDALIISHAGNLTEELVKIIDASGFPVVYLNEKKSHNAVFVDDLRGAQEITRHLVAQGNRKIIYYSNEGENHHYSAADRKAGYKKAMTAAGLRPEVFEATDQNEDEFYTWLKAHNDVEAIACYNDLFALQIFRILYRTKLKVPQNLALTGFGDDFARDCCPVALTTMRTPFYEMGKAAVEMALELLNGKVQKVPARVFTQELVVRDSTTRKG